MIEIVGFCKSHIERAKALALMNYNEERANVTALPQINELPIGIKEWEHYVDNGLGVTMLDGDKMLGFLCCYEPWDNAHDSTAKGTFSAIHAHGAVSENKDMIYKRLYQAAAKIWVRENIAYHSVALYAHDTQVVNAFFTYGFGLRCIDAIRPLVPIEISVCEGVIFSEFAKINVAAVREMRKLHIVHLGESPCFMESSNEHYEEWLTRAEKRDSRLFVATLNDKPIAYMEVINGGETFATEVDSVQNICGAFCLPEHRGKGITQNLLNYVISILKNEGYKSLGVDFESFNPTAVGFWLKYFTAYTNSVVRRIDECALHN